MNTSPLPPNSGRVAVITGAGSGIGRAVAIELARRGWSLALLGRRIEALKETADLLQDPAQSLCCTVDVSQADEVAASFTRLLTRFGRVDLLFNNAGVSGPTGRIDRVASADFEKTLAVNVTGQWLCAAQAFGIMAAQLPQGGRIINNGSIAARVPRPHAAAYAISKHATTGLTRSIALDGRPLGITATQLDIGNAATELLSHFGDAGSVASSVPGTTASTASATDSALKEPTFDVSHVAQLVANIANLPTTTAVPELVVTAAGMPYDGRG